MKCLLLLVLILTQVQSQQQCIDPRPQACTREYRPVCGIYSQCIRQPCSKTYGNKCDACADKNVQRYTDGACDKDNSL